ncbi:MAG TPA: SDR family oxidoreductase [Acidimicrobiales bacterium]
MSVRDDRPSVVRPPDLVVVVGASGYIGGRLVGDLLDAGFAVRCVARTPRKLEAAPWRHRVDVVQGDVERDLGDAFADAAAVYFLVHSIGEAPDWVERERRGAENVRDAAARAGVRRIVYLGGLGDDHRGEGQSDGDPTRHLSEHLASRHRVGRVLAQGPVPVTELRAAVIIGSGSASFEMLRYLVENLPAMVTPKWVDTRCQPIGVRDVLRYLVEVVGLEEAAGTVLDIGGPDVLTYRLMMSVYADEAGLRPRLVIPVPVLSPRLSSWWVGLVTPLPRSLARPLVNSLVNEVVVHDHTIERLCPGPLLSYRESVRLALGRTRAGTVISRWADADTGTHTAGPAPTDPGWAGGTEFTDRRVRTTTATPLDVYAAICHLGGERGWHRGEWLWRVRGFLDKLVGGPGLRRGRRNPRELRIGEPLDFWRVEAIEPGGLVRLHAEMVLPGEAWLEWHIEPDGATGTKVTQLALFRPRGLWGNAYWYGIAPFPRFVFPGLLEGLITEAEASGSPARRGCVACLST